MADYGTTDRLTGGTPTADAGTAANAVDNNETTNWDIVANSPHWFKYDFGVGVTWAIGKLRAKPYLNLGPNAFNVTGSNNDSAYDTLYSGNMANGSANWQEFTWINSTKYRYIKINITSQFTAEELTVYEFEAMEMLPVAGGILNWFFN